ncbi:uncharacterized protein [Argopecten irradians]|uniref:uncharacterized protein n=1 Tax=Argopecten irradians TaxID=31199 RepID=UPI00371C3F6F
MSPLMLVFIVITTVSSKDYYCSHQAQIIDKDDFGMITTRLPWDSNNRYSNNLKCVWTIDAGEVHRIRITFTKIRLEPNIPMKTCEDGDFLSIQDGETEKAQILVNICPGLTNPQEIISKDGHLYLVFTSDQSSFLDYSGIEMKFEVFDKTDCPPGWVNHLLHTYRDYDVEEKTSCYQVKTHPANGARFLDAQRFCTYSQSNLARIESNSTFNYVLDLSKKHQIVYYLWVGLTDRETEGTFQWLDGNSFNSMERMSSISLNDQNKNCVVLNTRFKKYQVMSCDNSYFYICEMRLGQPDIYTVPEYEATEGNGELSADHHYVIEATDLIWIFIGLIVTVCSIVACILIKIYRSRSKYVDYSSSQTEGQRSTMMLSQRSSQTQQESEVAQANLLQTMTQPLTDPLINPCHLPRPSAPTLRELQPVPHGSEQEDPPSYWEVVYGC